MNKITIIKSTVPNKVCKTYSLGEDGKLIKSVIASTTEGEAVTVEVNSAQAMAKVLGKVTERDDLVICPGVWQGAEVGQKFKIYSELDLAEKVCGVRAAGKVQGGVIEHDGELIAARLKRGIDNSAWLLLDADNPPGMPKQWADMDIAARLQMWEAFVPGISSCERIELRGSSARVSHDGVFGGASHAWIRVSDPDKIEILKAHIRVKMVLHGAAFKYHKLSKLDEGKVVGIEDRSVFDLAVFDTGRLVFCAKPEVLAEGYRVSHADIEVINEGGGVLDLSAIEVPQQRDLELLKQKTGDSIRLTLSDDGKRLSTYEDGKLTLETEIQSRGIIKPLGEWIEGEDVGFHLRCEAPFRESQSEAAFIKIGETGKPFVHDIGNGTTYSMWDKPFSPIEKSEPSTKSEIAVGGDKSDIIHPDTSEEAATGGWFDWTFLKARGVFHNIANGEECKTDAFNLAFGAVVPTMMNASGKPYKPQPAKYLLHELKVPQAHDTMYWPKAARLGAQFFEHDHRQYVNSFMPSSMPEPEPNWVQSPAWKIVEDHIKMILPEDHGALIQWMAHNVQKPGEKILWSPIIKGVQGDGKSTLFRIMMAAMGELNVREVSSQELNSEFNGWAEGSCVVCLEEIRVKGKNRYEVMDRLKPVITNNVVSVVRKGRDGRNIPNCTNYMALTNHEDALALDKDDRRWGVFFTKYKNRSELLAETDEFYWRRLHNAYQQNPGVIRAWLESIPLTGFNCNDAPHTTKAKERMIELARTDAEANILELIDLGAVGVCADVISTSHLNQALRDRGFPALSTNHLSKTMNVLGYEKVTKQVKWRNEPLRIYVPEGRDFWVNPNAEATAKIREMLDSTAEFRRDVSPF